MTPAENPGEGLVGGKGSILVMSISQFFRVSNLEISNVLFVEISKSNE